MARASRREQVLEAARALFIANGYRGTSLRDIARKAGVTMGAIYHHFCNKEGLYLAVLQEHRILPYILRLGEMVASAEFPDNIEDVGREIWQAARENKDFFQLVYVDILEFGGRNVKPLVQEMRAAGASVAEPLLRERIARGELVDLHPQVVLRCLTDLFLHYYLEEMMLEKSLAADVGLDDREVSRQLARILLDGIRPRPR